jgi:uncharacterized protein with WD repeat
MNEQGKGRYLYQNCTKGDIVLSRPTRNGVKYIASGQQFEGDDYYLQMVRTHDLKLVRILEETTTFTSEKVLLEQPPTVTSEGKVESLKKKLNEQLANTNEDVLINESPIDGLEII